ncbi:hypothetical protein [Natronobacterium haloterrestre]|nr:hypothetical protein [Halobiforma haloterrestris]
MSAPSKTKRIGKTGNQQESSGVVRRLVLFGGPVGAAVAMWFHPHAGHDVYASLSAVADTFVVIHVLLFASLATIAMGLYFLSSGYRGLSATLARAGTGVFGFFYLGYVAIVGVAKGLLIREGRTLPAEQQAGVAEAVQYLHTEPLLFAAGVIGAVGYLVAVGALAVVLYRADAPRVPLALLVASSVAIGAHHGPLAVAGMGSFVVAVGWLEFGWSRATDWPE